MGYINYNPNPARKLVGDCVIRAISKVTEQSWEDTYFLNYKGGFFWIFTRDIKESKEIVSTST